MRRRIFLLRQHCGCRRNQLEEAKGSANLHNVGNEEGEGEIERI